MNNINVNIADRDRNTVTFAKDVTLSGKRFGTPMPAHIGRERTQNISPHPDSYGVNEVHRGFRADELREGLDSDNSNFKRDIARAINNTTSGEVNIVFPALWVREPNETDVEDVEIRTEDFRPMVRFLGDITDMFSTPLLGFLIDEIRNGDEPEEAYRTLVSNTENFLRACEYEGVETPVMGVLSAIPDIPEEGILKENILEMFAERDLRAFCVDFYRYTITTPDNLEEYALFLGEWLKERQIDRDSLLYAINMRRVPRGNSEIKEPLKFAGFSALFDIVGGYHVPLKREEGDYPDDGFERNPWIFEWEECHCREYSPQEVQVFPYRTGYDCEELAEKAAKYDYRDVEKRLNPEQMVFAAKELRRAIVENRVKEFYRDESGISRTTIDRLTDFCAQYEQDTLG